MGNNEISIIKVGDLDIKKIEINNNDYLCISDFVPKDGTVGSGITIINWLSKVGTINFLGLWEKINNQNFNVMELHNIKNKTKEGERFSISSKQWIAKTNAIGIKSKAGRYNSGTYAHIDIAMEFASWLSPEFKLYLITEFQRLKKQEAEVKNELQDWNNHRWLSKVNYKLHTDAIQSHIVPTIQNQKYEYWAYVSEAEMLNKIIFNMTSQEFKQKFPQYCDSNMREEIATTKQLQILSNLESYNATMIREGLTQEQRFNKLTIEAEEQQKSIKDNNFTRQKLIKNDDKNLFKQITADHPELATQQNPAFERTIDKILNVKKD